MKKQNKCPYPDSWEEFLIAVKQMRDCQKEYSLTGGPISHNEAKRCEEKVDAFIRKKRAEWESQLQPRFF